MNVCIESDQIVKRGWQHQVAHASQLHAPTPGCSCCIARACSAAAVSIRQAAKLQKGPATTDRIIANSVPLSIISEGTYSITTHHRGECCCLVVVAVPSWYPAPAKQTMCDQSRLLQWTSPLPHCPTAAEGMQVACQACHHGAAPRNSNSMLADPQKPFDVHGVLYGASGQQSASDVQAKMPSIRSEQTVAVSLRPHQHREWQYQSSKARLAQRAVVAGWVHVDLVVQHQACQSDVAWSGAGTTH